MDWVGLCKELSHFVDDDEFGIIQLVKFQYEVLGYVDYIEDSLDWRYVVITDLNTTYSPKFNAYSIGKGKTTEMKIHKAINKRDKSIVVSFNFELNKSFIPP